MSLDTRLPASDTMRSGYVAQKTAGMAIGLVAILGFALASGAGAAGASAATSIPPMPTTITVKVPDAGWRLRVERVLELDREVWVLAQLRREPGPAAQMIQRITAEIPVALPEKRLRVFVAGKSWAWPNDEGYEFVASLAGVVRRAETGRALYPPPEK